MKTINLSLLGFGHVGRAFVRLVLEKEPILADEYGLRLAVVGIKTGSHGAAINPDGINLSQALTLSEQGGSLDSLSHQPAPEDIPTFLKQCGCHAMAENTPVSYKDGQPALDHIRAALQQGISVVTANKGPIVHAHKELTQLAHEHGCRFLFESTVMDGAPIFSLWREALPAATLHSFRGILNSTTNLILGRMETGETLDQAVAYAQSIGIAETDPSGDVDGWDAAIKVAALVNVLMDIRITPGDVEREGIRAIGPDDVKSALDEGQRWKLICEAHREGASVQAHVKPQRVDRSDPHFSVMGTSSAITFKSDVLGALTITEEDPGPHTTAYGLLADLLNILPNSPKP